MMLRKLSVVIQLSCILILGGCAPYGKIPEFVPENEIELRHVPFFSQKVDQCGPASLAMLLSYTGISLTPEILYKHTYIPGIQGSLQPELMAASRRSGRIPYTIDANPRALLEELQQDRPILILQNYGLDSMPAYHYAVVIGVDVDGNIILRSGTTERLEMSFTSFLMSWNRPGSWGMIVLRPGELPAHPDRERYLKEVSAFENVGYRAEATIAYQAALVKWPEDELVMFALANNYLGLGQNDSAEELYRHVLKDNPGNLAAANNLAETLVRKGCIDQAQTLIVNAVEEAHRQGSPFQEILEQTLTEVSRAKFEGNSRNCAE